MNPNNLGIVYYVLHKFEIESITSKKSTHNYLYRMPYYLFGND
jgi:hypothetical protein